MRIPKLRLHKGSGQALIEYRGKRHYLGKFGSPEAEQAYGHFIRQFLDSAGPTVGDSPTKPVSKVAFGDFVSAFLDWALIYYRDSLGASTNEYAMLRYAIKPAVDLYAELPVAQFGPVQLKAVRQRMVDQGWSRKYINHQVQRIRRAFRWGVENGYVPASVLAEVSAVAALKKNRTAARETSPIGPVDDCHIDAVLQHLSPTVQAMVQLQRRSGMRPQNICLLTPGQIDRSREVWVYKPATHKTGHAERVLEIPLGPQAQAILVPLLFGLGDDDFVFSPRQSAEEYRDRRRTKPREAIGMSSPIKRSRKRAPGVRYNSRSYRRAVLYGIQKVNAEIAHRMAEELQRSPTKEELAAKLIPHWHPHQLRHRRATEIRNQFGLEAAQVTLGHSKADVTQIYAKRDSELAEKVARETG